MEHGPPFRPTPVSITQNLPRIANHKRARRMSLALKHAARSSSQRLVSNLSPGPTWPHHDNSASQMQVPPRFGDPFNSGRLTNSLRCHLHSAVAQRMLQQALTPHRLRTLRTMLQTSSQDPENLEQKCSETPRDAPKRPDLILWGELGRLSFNDPIAVGFRQLHGMAGKTLWVEGLRIAV